MNNGWRIYNTQSINEVYSYISKRNEWKGIKHDRDKTFMQYQNITGLTETTVQEILGYDQFVKDFVLPKFWYIKVNKNNVDIVSEWRFGNDSKLSIGSVAGISRSSNEKGHNHNKGEFFDTEITFDQFKKYVLKENIEVKEGMFKKDEYIVFTESEEIGNFPLNYVFKQISDCTYLSVYKDKNGIQNGWEWYRNYNKSYEPRSNQVIKSNWRYAIAEEIAEYNRLDRPFDISTFKSKQPLKQAVHCQSKEEWDFVSEKINYKFITNFKLGYNDTININANCCECKRFYDNSNYNLLSFQEWCDLNGYKMENKCEFKIGIWYKNSNTTYAKCYQIIDPGRFQYNYVISSGNYSESFGTWNKHDNMVEASIEEIQQYLPDGHVDKFNWSIKPNEKFETGEWVIIIANSNDSKNCIGDIGIVLDDRWKNSSGTEVSVRVKVHNRNNNNNYTRFNEMRHATPEEINNHLISIGQILSVDTAVGLDCNAKVTPWNFDGVSSLIANSGVCIHQGYFNPNIVASRKISSSIADFTKDEVQLELMDIPKI